MSYWAIATMRTDSQLRLRMAACAAQEVPTSAPESWVDVHLWALVTQPGWDVAYEGAVDGGNTEPGKDPTVISDTMILDAVHLLHSQDA